MNQQLETGYGRVDKVTAWESRRPGFEAQDSQQYWISRRAPGRLIVTELAANSALTTAKIRLILERNQKNRKNKIISKQKFAKQSRRPVPVMTRLYNLSVKKRDTCFNSFNSLLLLLQDLEPYFYLLYLCSFFIHKIFCGFINKYTFIVDFYYYSTFENSLYENIELETKQNLDGIWPSG